MPRALLLALALGLLAAVPAQAASVPDEGRAWAPPPVPEPRFTAAPAPHVHDLAAADGTRIRIETWLPVAAPGGAAPPARVPVVAIPSPYHRPGADRRPALTELLTGQGLAVAMVHVRGTGASTGCYSPQSPENADDLARAIHWLGERAPWAAGAVGLYGKSNEGGEQANVAGRGDRALLRSLKAIVPASPVLSHTDFRTFDGVPIALSELVFTWASVDLLATAQSGDAPEDALDRSPCQAAYAANAADPSGVPTAWDVARDMRLSAADIDVPVLLTYGLYETQTRMLAGWFDQLGRRAARPAKKVALLGQWRHDFPDENHYEPSWSRADWDATVVAWFDRWLRGTPNGVDAWPSAQVQDRTGQWRTEPDFPRDGGPTGQLALGPGGALGATAPTGATELDPGRGATRAATAAAGQPPAGGAEAVFDTGPVAAPVRISGVPVLDLWVRLTRPGGHVVASLEVQDAGGTRVVRTRRLGARSLRHLDPIAGHRFAQQTGRDAPTGVPLRVPVRFEPTDLVVPAGGRLVLRLGVAGAAENGETYDSPDLPGVPPAEHGPITVLHDCAHPSTLRFDTPAAVPDRIDVLEADQDEPLGAAGPTTAPVDPPGGPATRPVCGRAPVPPSSG